MIQRKVLVKGRVQGVGFRQATEREAAKYPALNGYVRNLDDGRVEARFVGEASSVLAMAAWCGSGPPAAHVEGLEVLEEAPDPALGPFRQIR